MMDKTGKKLRCKMLKLSNLDASMVVEVFKVRAFYVCFLSHLVHNTRLTTRMNQMALSTSIHLMSFLLRLTILI